MPSVTHSPPLQLRHCVRCLAIGLCAALACNDAWARDIRAFTDHQHPVTAPVGVQVVELDLPARLEAELNAQLPADQGRSAATVQERLAQGGAALHQRLAAAYEGVVEAWRFGVTHLPAVVVDQRYVVYGEPDVARAVARIDAYRGQP